MAEVEKLDNPVILKGHCAWCGKWAKLKITIWDFRVQIEDYMFKASHQYRFCSQTCLEKWLFTHAVAWCYQVRNKLVEKPDKAMKKLLEHRRVGKLLAELPIFEKSGE